MWHLAAFTASHGAVTDTQTPALTDDILAIQNGNFVPEVDFDLGFAYAGGLLLDRMRLGAPSIRQITPSFIRPVNLGDNPIADPNVANYLANPFRVRALEEIGVQSTTTGIGPSRVTGLLGLFRGIDPIPRGNVWCMRGTSATAAVANTWTTVAVTWADNLPTGRYGLVALEMHSATGIACRAILENETLRPGFLAALLATNRGPSFNLDGSCGLAGRFSSNRIPIPQVLCSAADAAQTFYLHLVRLG